METFSQSVKYEVVIGVSNAKDDIQPFLIPQPDGSFFTGVDESKLNIRLEEMKSKWKKYAKEFFESNDVYVSAIAIPGHALYHEEWGCPLFGEKVLSFYCTANPAFIKDLNKYEEGILYITKRLKRDFEQHTITITKIPATVCYLTDEDNLEE